MGQLNGQVARAGDNAVDNLGAGWAQQLDNWPVVPGQAVDKSGGNLLTLRGSGARTAPSPIPVNHAPKRTGPACAGPVGCA